MKIYCVGEAMIELSTLHNGNEARLAYAGDTLNTAIYLKRGMKPEHQVFYVTVLGKDYFSQNILDLMQSENIETDHIQLHPVRIPGLYAISKNANGDREFTYWRDQSAARTLFSNSEGNLDFSALEGAEILYLSAITLAILPKSVVAGLFEWILKFRSDGGKFVFDSNFRPRLWNSRPLAIDTIEQAWRICDIGLPSIDDEMALHDCDFDAAVARLRNYMMPVLVIKNGASGPLIFENGKQIVCLHAFAKSTKVVDTTAAGDSFNGGFLSALLSGQSVEEAAHAGHNLAIRVIGHQGAIIPN